MSWHFSQALVEAFSADICLDGAQSALSNTNPTQRLFSSSDRMMDFCRRSQSGMTCEHLTEDLGEAVLTSFLEAFPVRTSVPQEKAQGSTENALVYGPRWRGSFARYDRATSSWKTPQCSFLAALEEFSETWPKWGLMRDGECWVLTKWVLPMNESASGLSVPTPCKNEHAGTSKKRYRHSPHFRGAKTAEALRTCETDPSYSHPQFIEKIMGWPTMWTGLAPLGTGKFQEWRQQHSIFSRPTTTNPENDNEPLP